MKHQATSAAEQGIRQVVGVAHHRLGPERAAWVAEAAGIELPDPVAHDGVDDLVDAALDAVWQHDTDRSTELGQVFTPRAVARQLLLEAELDLEGHLLDPSCGGGIFLVEALRLRMSQRLARGEQLREALIAELGSVHGVDIDPGAVRLARAVLALEVARRLDPVGLPLPDVRCADALELPGADPVGVGPLRWVVGNPPYLEAKRMDNARRRDLKAAFGGRLRGAWDLYIAFVERGLECLDERGVLGFVLPNKVLVARYAEHLRDRLLAAGRARALVDLSSLPIFRRVGVYPVLFVAGPTGGACRTAFGVTTAQPLGEAPLADVQLPHEVWRATGPGGVWFTLPDKDWVQVLSELASLPALRDVAEVRSTCSFHHKGMRERFVRPEAELPNGLPYLGGRSYLRRHEVHPFGFDWQGFAIDWQPEVWRAERNSLPPLEIFDGPKVVICQHARGVVAAADPAGRWVSKDVYPVVIPRERSAEQAQALTGLLNSRVASVIYALRHRGIQVGGAYLHVLPVFLHRLPVPVWTPELVAELARLTRAVAESGSVAAFEALDGAVMVAYGLRSAQIERVRAWADTHLGFGEAVFARR